MKKLALVFLFLVGCSSVPKQSMDVHCERVYVAKLEDGGLFVITECHKNDSEERDRRIERMAESAPNRRQ